MAMRSIPVPFMNQQKHGSMATLTAIGRIKLEKTRLDTAAYQVLYYLKESGNSSIREIAQHTGLPWPKVKNILNHYAGEDYRWIEWV